VPDLISRTKYAGVFEGHDLREYSEAHAALYDESNVAAMAGLLAELCFHEELGNSGDPDVRINDLTARVRGQIGWRDAN